MNESTADEKAKANDIASPVIMAVITSSETDENQISLSGIEDNTFTFGAYLAPDSVKVVKADNSITAISEKRMVIKFVGILEDGTPEDVVMVFNDADDYVTITIATSTALKDIIVQKVTVTELKGHIKCLKDSSDESGFHVLARGVSPFPLPLMVENFPFPLFSAGSRPFFASSFFSQIEDILQAEEEKVNSNLQTLLAELPNEVLENYTKCIPAGLLDDIVPGFYDAVIEEQHRRTLAKEAANAEAATSS